MNKLNWLFIFGFFLLVIPYCVNAKITEIETSCDLLECYTILETPEANDLSLSNAKYQIDLKERKLEKRNHNFDLEINIPNLEYNKIRNMKIEKLSSNTIKISGKIEGASKNYWGLSIGSDTSFLNSTWWNSSFDKRINVTIDNSNNANTLNDYMVDLNVSYDTNMSTDFDDLRFTWYNETEDTEIPILYWIDNKIDSVFAYLWVRVTQIQGNGNETVFMYFDNPLSISESDINTWDYYNDFDGLRTSDVNTTKGTGSYTIQTEGSNNVYSIDCIGGQKCRSLWNESSNLENYIITADTKAQTSFVNWVGLGYIDEFNLDMNNYVYARYFSNGQLYFDYNDTDDICVVDVGSFSANTWYKTVLNGTNENITVTIDDNPSLSNTCGFRDFWLRKGLLMLYTTDNQEARYDNVTQRQYSLPEPFGIFGDQQQFTPTTTTTTTTVVEPSEIQINIELPDLTRGNTFCLDNETLARNVTHQVLSNGNTTNIESFSSENCPYGCDLVTNVCNPNPFYLYAITGIVLIGILVVALKLRG